MKAFVLFVLTAIAALGAAGAAGAASRAHAANSPPCIPKYGTSGGHTYVDYCGPATATLKVGGRTYDFKDGYCSTDTKNKIDLQVQLGDLVLVHSPLNGGEPEFSLQDIKDGSLTIATVTADYAGKGLTNVGTVTLKGSVPAGGTFASGALAKPSFTGSWDCHGVIVSSP